jgi:hypothetical protein
MLSSLAISASVIGVWLRASRSRIRTALMTEVLMTLRIARTADPACGAPRHVPAGPGFIACPPGVNLYGVRAGPGASLPESVHIYN